MFFSFFFIPSERINLMNHHLTMMAFAEYRSHSLFSKFNLLILVLSIFSVTRLNFFYLNCFQYYSLAYCFLIRLADFLLGQQVMQLLPIDPSLYEFYELSAYKT
jgi:hypothetical protein